MRGRVPGSFSFALFVTVFLGFASPTTGAPEVIFPAKPAPENFYVDEAGLLAPEEAQAIDKIAESLFRDLELPIVVATVSSLEAHNAAGYTVERYAFELFNHWGVGSERRNYGMLFLVSRGDRRARIELGAAWGHSYHIQAQRIMDTLIIPRFKEGRFSEGVLAGVRGMDAMARGLALPKPERPWWALPLTLGALGLVIAVIVSLFKNGQKGWGWALIAMLAVILFFLLRAAAQSRGSGGAFGGGSSGGGGASGSW